MMPHCDSSMPPDASFSSGLTDAQLRKLFG